MKIIVYEDRYKDDLIRMVSEARKALGISPEVRKDLYDIKANYLDKGDMFWVAVSETGEVTGCLGFSRSGDTDEAFLHRFYISPEKKRTGIGTQLLKTAEAYMYAHGIRIVRVHMGGEPDVWYESYAFYQKHGFTAYASRYMMKKLRDHSEF